MDVFSDNISKEKEVAVLMGSKSDMPVVERTIKTLESFNIKTRVFIASAHKSPELVIKIAKKAEEENIKIIIAAAGMAAHLAGFVAAHTVLPVIGLPISATLKGIDALFSTVQMPKGVPVLCVGIDAAENAAIAACEILSIENVIIREKLKNYRKSLEQAIIEKNKDI